MFIDLGIRVKMNQDQFYEEMERRRNKLNLGPNDHIVGCPLCLAPLVAPMAESPDGDNELGDSVALQGAN
jgi:hypothetical protein